MDQWEVDKLVSTIQRITAEGDRAFQVDQMVQVVELLLAASTIEKVEDLLYEGESPGDVDLAVRVSDHLRCVGAAFENWWENTSPRVEKVTVLRPMEKELAALRKQAESLEAEVAAVRKTRDEVSRQEKEVKRLLQEKRETEAELLNRDQHLHENEKRLEELHSSIDELKKLEARLAPDIVSQALESALTAERSSLLEFEEAVKSIADQSRANRLSSENLLADDKRIVDALRAVEGQAGAAELLDAGRLVDQVQEAFGRFADSATELERRIGDYLCARDEALAKQP